jgi:hypothetical protein
VIYFHLRNFAIVIFECRAVAEKFAAFPQKFAIFAASR